MKLIKFILTAGILIAGLQMKAQNHGRIDYVQTIDLHKNLKGVQKALKAFLPEKMETNLTFIFNEEKARLKEVKDENPDKNVKMSMTGASINALIDYKSQLIKSFHTINKKEYITEEALEVETLEFSFETKEILGYTCKKANLGTDDEMILWIATDLSVNASPMLPLVCKEGAILAIENEKISFEAKSINLDKPTDSEFTFNESARKITKEQLKDLEQEQMEEMSGGKVQTIKL